MTKIRPLETMILMFAFMLLAGLAALVLLGSVQAETATTVWQSQSAAQQVAVDWKQPGEIDVPSGLIISAHSAKHNGETEEIYAKLLEGKCAEVAKLCGGSEEEFAYFCLDPVTGIVGAILQIGDEITTGYYEKPGSGYWVRRVPREKWRACDD